MNRHVAAFLLAPLIVPLLTSALVLPVLGEVPSLYWLGLVTAAAVSYAGAVLAGAPAYAALRSGGWTAFWIAPLVGFVVGVIMAIGLIGLFPAAVQSGALSYILEMFPDAAHPGEIVIANPQIWSTSADSPPAALIGPGMLGALVGTALWLIGRPDRP
jgi:hypothetical protein